MLDLNMGATNQVHKLNVTFAYRRWFPESEFLNRLNFNPNLSDFASGAVLGQSF